MKKFIYSIITALTVSTWSYANYENEFENIHSTNSKIVSSRVGEYYNGAVSYRDLSFPLHIYWDLDINGYNLYAFIEGSSYAIDSSMHTLTHVATYNSECTDTRFDFVIKCNYSHSNYTGFWSEVRHVSFHVTFYPSTHNCSFDILVDEEGPWRDPDLD